MGMRFGKLFFAALALCLLTATGVSAQNGSVSGRVANQETGAPIAGASVEVVAQGGRVVGTALTGADGNYRIADVPAGTYTIVFSGLGYSTSRLENIRIAAGQNTIAGGSLAASAFLLNPVIVSVGRRQEKAIEAPASVSVVSAQQVERRPAVTPVDHLLNTPGVDVARTGVQSSNVVVRGFNNIFSGSLHTLTDNRIASVPSLRVNFMNFVPTTNEDIERMEVVLGPGAALYGPNTANGVLHIMTKSPLAETGTVASVAGGEQGVLHISGRTAHRLSDRFGFKVSGQYLQADEWAYTDPVEAAERAKFTGAQAAFFRTDLMRAVGIDGAEADRRIALIGNRDFDIQRWSGEARADWAITDNTRAILTTGMTMLGNGIELTGLGAGQAKDWRYNFYQARLNSGRFFLQGYLNTSDAGETYLLRNGAPIVDKSRLWVAQAQHSTQLGTRQTFTYGVDFQYTDPRTEGTINGKYEDDDETTEVGAYIQSQTALSPKLDLVLAGRVDDHSGLPEKIFSPRAALVFKPAENHAFRATFNRAFSTPSSLNQYLDLGSAMPDANAAALGFSVRVQGTGRDGFRFRDSNGNLQMRMPATGAALHAADASLGFQSALNALALGAAAQGKPIDPQLLGYLRQLQPTAAQVGTNFLHPANLAAGSRPLSELVIEDVDPIRESTTTAFEVGYKGVLGDRFLVAVDGWYEQRKNLVTPLTILTPFILMNGESLGAFLVQSFMRDLQMGQAQAVATAAALVGSPTQTGLATIPVGVVSSADVNANGAQLLTTYYNVDDALDVYGVDLAATALLNDQWSVSGTASFVNENQFETDRGQSVTLNAPKTKGSVALNYNNQLNGFNGELRARYNDAYPVRSGVYNGTLCIGGAEAGAESCVDSFTLLDLTLGYNLPVVGASLQLSVQNLLDEAYRPFPGVPTMGRMALLRLRYEF